jgi:hypothetical protein
VAETRPSTLEFSPVISTMNAHEGSASWAIHSASLYCSRVSCRDLRRGYSWTTLVFRTPLYTEETPRSQYLDFAGSRRCDGSSMSRYSSFSYLAPWPFKFRVVFSVFPMRYAPLERSLRFSALLWEAPRVFSRLTFAGLDQLRREQSATELYEVAPISDASRRRSSTCCIGCRGLSRYAGFFRLRFRNKDC